jgi:hypothetical protein
MYEQLRRAAELAHQPVEVIITQSLAHSLPPLLEDIPLAYQPDVYPLLEMGDAELQREMEQNFPSDRWAEYEAMLAKKKEATLSTEEQKRLDMLRKESDVLTFRKGYAAVLLKRRGDLIPIVEELERSK